MFELEKFKAQFEDQNLSEKGDVRCTVLNVHTVHRARIFVCSYFLFCETPPKLASVLVL